MTMLCSNTNHSKDVKASHVEVVVRSEPRTDGKPDVEARDGKFISLGRAFCGTHRNSYTRRRYLYLAVQQVEDLMTFQEEPRKAWLKQWYEDRLDVAEAKRMADEREYFEVNLKHSKVQQKLIQSKNWRHDLLNLDIVNDDEQERPVTGISVSHEGGVASVSISDYAGHSGQGRGNVSWLKCLREALDRAEAVMNEWNANIKEAE